MNLNNSSQSNNTTQKILYDDDNFDFDDYVDDDMGEIPSETENEQKSIPVLNISSQQISIIEKKKKSNDQTAEKQNKSIRTNYLLKNKLLVRSVNSKLRSKSTKVEPDKALKRYIKPTFKERSNDEYYCKIMNKGETTPIYTRKKKSLSTTYSKNTSSSKEKPPTFVVSSFVFQKDTMISRREETEIVNRLSHRTKPNPCLRLKEMPLWDNISIKNRWHSPTSERQSKTASCANDNIQRRCFSRSPLRNVEERSTLQKRIFNPSRLRDFTSQISNVPGPNHLNKRDHIEKAFNISERTVTPVHLYMQSSYYQNNENEGKNIFAAQYPSYKKRAKDEECSPARKPNVLKKFTLFYQSKINLQHQDCPL